MTTINGECHCGAVAFTLLQGEDALRSYRFGSELIDHRTCETGGCNIFGKVPMDDGELVAISVPCLELKPEQLAASPPQAAAGTQPTGLQQKVNRWLAFSSLFRPTLKEFDTSYQWSGIALICDMRWI